MSTTSNQYLIIGIKLEYENNAYEKYEDYIYNRGTKEKEIDVLYDGKDGRYIIIGKVIACSDDDYGLEGPMEIQEPDSAFKYKVCSSARKLFCGDWLLNDVKLWLVTEYS